MYLFGVVITWGHSNKRLCILYRIIFYCRYKNFSITVRKKIVDVRSPNKNPKVLPNN